MNPKFTVQLLHSLTILCWQQIELLLLDEDEKFCTRGLVQGSLLFLTGTRDSLILLEVSLNAIHFQALRNCSEQSNETEIAAFTSLVGICALKKQEPK